MKKITALAVALMIAAVVAFSGCKREQGQQGGQPPPGSAPTTTDQQ